MSVQSRCPIEIVISAYKLISNPSQRLWQKTLIQITNVTASWLIDRDARSSVWLRLFEDGNSALCLLAVLRNSVAQNDQAPRPDPCLPVIANHDHLRATRRPTPIAPQPCKLVSVLWIASISYNGILMLRTFEEIVRQTMSREQSSAPLEDYVLSDVLVEYSSAATLPSLSTRPCAFRRKRAP